MSIRLHPNATGSVKKVIRSYPLARKVDEPMSPSLIPKGITLHYTAGASAESSIRHLQNLRSGFGYHFVIDRDGTVFQMTSLAAKAMHAGPADWKGLSPNSHHIAIALANFGELKPANRSGEIIYENAYGGKVNKVVEAFGRFWEPATGEQEQTTFDLCLWLCQKFSLKGEDICGHDECCDPPGRKIDPGGIFGFSMHSFRMMMDRLMVLPMVF